MPSHPMRHYVAKLAEGVYVLHAFEKRTRADREGRPGPCEAAPAGQSAGAPEGYGGAVEKVKLTRSSGNVFRDLGFSVDEAEYLKVRGELMVNLQKVITGRRLKQAQAAKLLGVTQPRVSDLSFWASV